MSSEEIHRGKILGEVLREARGDRTLGQVALSAGVSPETLRKIETGRIATPSFGIVAALAGELGLSLDSIWMQLQGLYVESFEEAS